MVQIREYEELKMEASRQAARYLQELDSVNREQKSDQDRLDNEMRRKGELENKHRQKVYIHTHRHTYMEMQRTSWRKSTAR